MRGAEEWVPVAAEPSSPWRGPRAPGPVRPRLLFSTTPRAGSTDAAATVTSGRSGMAVGPRTLIAARPRRCWGVCRSPCDRACDIYGA